MEGAKRGLRLFPWYRCFSAPRTGVIQCHVKRHRASEVGEVVERSGREHFACLPLFLAEFLCKVLKAVDKLNGDGGFLLNLLLYLWHLFTQALPSK
jgi:hypothetical protein